MNKKSVKKMRLIIGSVKRHICAAMMINVCDDGHQSSKEASRITMVGGVLNVALGMCKIPTHPSLSISCS
jgi:hypothetical protein